MPTPINLPLSVVRQEPNPLSGPALPPSTHPPVECLYIHTPFCTHKCHYCDFYSFVDTQDRQQLFVSRLIDELTHLAAHAGPLRTVFIGGGTPSLIAPALWSQLLVALNELFDLSRMRAHADSVPAGEFTVECNPETTTGELLGILREGGVNRVSVGAQSFQPKHLKTLERWHNPENVSRAIALAKAAGIPRQSIDLIYAIPGQTLGEWEQDLREGLGLGLTHISCYNLTYEPNTAMTKRLERGEFEPLDEETEAAMFSRTHELCAAAGLARYEVSNYARPGAESLHNLAYWEQAQWLAAGPSASGHVYANRAGWHAGSWRFKNVPRLSDYLDSQGFSPVVDTEPPDPSRLIRERIMMGLRLAQGVDAVELLRDAAAIAPTNTLARTASTLKDTGSLKPNTDRWILTDAGYLIADGVASALMRAVERRS